MIRSLIILFVSYILAAPFTSLISMDLTQTAWTNILTYVFWLMGIPLSIFVLFCVAFVFLFIKEMVLGK